MNENDRLDPGSAVGRRRLERRVRRVVERFGIAITLAVGTMMVLFGLAACGFVAVPLLGVISSAILFNGLPVLLLCAVGAVFVSALWSRHKDGAASAAGAAREAFKGQTTASRAGPQPASASLEALRSRVARESKRRVRLFVPLALLAASGLFFAPLGHARQKGSPLVGFVVLHAMAGFGGWLLASTGPRRRYAAAFKREVLPDLLRRHGDLHHVIGTMPELARLVEAGVLPAFDRSAVDDGLTGTCRERTISISELTLFRKGGRHEQTLFRGLLIDLAVDSPFHGTTLVRDAADTGRAPGGLMRVHLEDRRFDKIYKAYGSDQIEARAVLTPAVMERLLVMSDGTSFHPPRFMLEGQHISFAFHRPDAHDMFEPPRLESHDATTQIAGVEAELAMVFGLVDAMIDMHARLRNTDRMPGGYA